ncbi:hypothetical protein QBC46DRAFT_436950 [Diplogelasinospora grovesii]|uniref:Uncharacterized protein n=1 Tax=Diplogelasinospora grovesii TaxID=303347 RepID=A0AAN6S4M4_9PEZI|nr:hypothetical protein QBC46DRAFT_436950 [Diplogelasinospora grovesii]
MCFTEYVAYQCGHRSPPVLRVCPLTTVSHKYPVCGSQATKQHNAPTMCTACERQLHTRWVLIREWEHRWLHERGACGCDVVFPGLLTRPRVVGGGGGDRDDQAESIPAIYEETITKAGDLSNNEIVLSNTTNDNKRYVAVRIPSLFAAEWLADHAPVHREGRCSCPANFDPFRPEVKEEELTPAERDLLRTYRELDYNQQQSQPEPSVQEQADEITARITQVTRAFGPPPQRTQSANQQGDMLSLRQRLSNLNLAATVNGQRKKGRNKNKAKSGFRVSRSGSDLVAARDTAAQYPPRTSNASSRTAVPILALSVATPAPSDDDTGGPADSGLSTALMPIGAAALPAKDEFVNRWPMFTTPAELDFSSPTRPPPPSCPVSSPRRDLQDASLDISLDLAVSPSTEEQRPLPICGLPIGAGPEGQSHMPHWYKCRLSGRPGSRRRSNSFS